MKNLNNRTEKELDLLNALDEIRSVVNDLKTNTSIHFDLLEGLGNAIARNKEENTNQTTHMVAYEAIRVFECLIYLIDKNREGNETILNYIQELLDNDQ